MGSQLEPPKFNDFEGFSEVWILEIFKSGNMESIRKCSRTLRRRVLKISARSAQWFRRYLRKCKGGVKSTPPLGVLGLNGILT